MQRTGNVIGGLLILAGSVFSLQGLNILLGSFMSGRREWLVIGVVMVVAGAGLWVGVNRRPGRP